MANEHLLNRLYKLTNFRENSGRTLLSPHSLTKKELSEVIILIAEDNYNYILDDLRKQISIIGKQIVQALADKHVSCQEEHHLNDYRTNLIGLQGTLSFLRTKENTVCKKRLENHTKAELVELFDGISGHVSEDLKETIKWFGIK